MMYFFVFARIYAIFIKIIYHIYRGIIILMNTRFSPLVGAEEHFLK